MTTYPYSTRPFGAHLSMNWWKPLVLLIALPLLMVVAQFVLYEVVKRIEGEGPADLITPLQLLALNLGMGIAGVLSIPLVAWLAKVPMRNILSFPRRFDLRRLALYLAGTALLVGVGNALLALLAPETTTWTSFEITGTTVTLLLVTVLTTPLQSAAEEFMYRGALLPAFASWVGAVRPALVLGVVLSSIVFSVVHGSADPWLLGYFAFFGACAAMMMLISGGLEASIALHVSNNGLTMILNALFAGGGAVGLDRSVGSGGPHLLIMMALLLVAVGMVWILERRRRGPVRGGRTEA